MKIRCIAIATLLSVISFSTQALPANTDKVTKQETNSVQKSQKIDLNKADAASLTHSFKGIGARRAQAIIQYREAHQGFKSVEELSEVKGFGEKFVTKNLNQLKEVFTVNS